MYNYVLVMELLKGIYYQQFFCCCFFIFFFCCFFVLFFYFLDLDVYVLYQCSFGIFYAIKVVSFYLYFIYLKNMGKIFHKLLFFEYMIFISIFDILLLFTEIISKLINSVTDNNCAMMRDDN